MTLIEEDRDMALGYVEKLSKVYRYLLKTKDRGLVRLDEELDFIKSYAGLVSGRFGTGFRISINIPSSEYNYFIPPLGLQLLLENALKHNVISANAPLKVDFSLEEDNYITVRNNLTPKRSDEKSHEMGLKNLMDQYSFFTDEQVIIDSDDSFFTVKIPLLKRDNEIPYEETGAVK
jgi:LytS/YehU family sensor histidine kinase